MSFADETALQIEDLPVEDLPDDDCTHERTATDWFKARAVPPITFIGRPAEPARELAAAIQDAAARSQFARRRCR